jgi:hypothetical protein
MSKRPYRPFDRSRIRNWRERPAKPRTEAQEAATDRNFRIMQLRALWHLAYVLSTDARLAVRALIDADLKAVGALTTQEQNAKVLRQYQAEEIPF